MTSEKIRPEETQSSAYVLDVPYTWSYFEYQSPILLSYVARLNGYDMPPLDAPFSYCDLGCGNGVSINLLAAVYPQAQFYGVDFNAEHITNAQTLADQAGLTNVTFIHASFEQYTQNNPSKFDYIAMHGIYSWVGADIRQQICTLIDKTLNPGGLIYVCYNTLPGWAQLMPLWKMMQTYIKNLDVDSISKAKIGLQNIAHIRNQDGAYFRANPSASRYLDRLLARDPHYVAHEFCNGCFEPQYFADVADDMAGIGLAYAGTAKIHRNNINNIVSQKHIPHLDAAPNRLEREARTSFIRNEFFRRDIYIRDKTPVTPTDHNSLFDDIIVGAIVPEYQLRPKIKFSYRTLDLDQPLFRKLLKIIKAGRLSFSDLCIHADLTDFNQRDITAAIHDLIAGGQFQPLLKPAVTRPPQSTSTYRLTASINRAFMENRLLLDGKTYVTSPLLGSAHRLSLINGLFTLALDGCTLIDARKSVTDKLQNLTPEQRANLGLAKDFQANKLMDEATRRFVKRCLPVLVKFGILSQN